MVCNVCAVRPSLFTLHFGIIETVRSVIMTDHGDLDFQGFLLFVYYLSYIC